MTTPTVTELPVQLEPTTTDSFLEPGPVLRELDRRTNDGIDVRMLWEQGDDCVAIAVFDAKTGDAFEIRVEGAAALDAFNHPFAHAAVHGKH